ncbi:ribosome hibernation factor-recruiting GTPase MRF [Umezawaea tangerina]|uniref:G3E family GTPase n=1 Tax=Umezawaea tangerina TaxID=84725 RepID=A0A2T0TLR7_9PSEU|nr:GTP-binding protein [Umezawaea tangerina]PRY46561.1 G3E family GTPase [Umezawaea tangerina]
MKTVVVMVAGLGEHRVAERVWRAREGSVLVRHDLGRVADGVVRRWVDGRLTVLELAHGCVSCALRHDLLPLLRELAGRTVVLHLDPAIEPEALCVALPPEEVHVEAVISVVDRETWLADATGEVTLAERGFGVGAGDERTVAQVVVGHVEFADALVLAGDPGDIRTLPVLDRLAPGVPRQELSSVDVDALTAAAGAGRLHDAFGPLLRGVPLEPDGRVSVVHFTDRRPFHPQRLHEALDVLLEGVVRTRGRLWVATRPDTALWLESAGGGLRIGDAGPWLAAVEDWSGVDPERRTMASLDWDPRCGDRGQEIVVIAHEAAPDEIAAALRAALLTDEEIEQGDGPLRAQDPFAREEAS